MKRFLSLILAISVCCMSFVSALGVSATIDTSKRLSVSTNTTGPRYIVDGNGNPVNLFGMARCQYHASEENVLFGNSVNDLVSHYRKFGINYMRLAIDLSDIVGAGIGDSLSLTTDEAIDNYISTNIDPDVQAIISAGMYVGLDIHMYAPSTNATAEQTIAYANNNYLPVLKRLAYIYKDEPMIANIEIWNEPNIGESGTAPTDEAWNVALRTFYINAVQALRQIDETRIIIVSDSNAGWGNNISSFWGNNIADLGSNVVFSAHVSIDQFGEETACAEYTNWVKNIASNLNICVMFNEVETEPGISSETTIQNFCDFLAETKDTYHFSSCLWRPHEDSINFADIWGTNGWAANYTGVVLTKADTLIPYGGPNFTFNGNEWNPQLTVPMHSFSVSKNYESITFDIKLPDYNTLKDYMSAGSRSSLGGGEFAYDYSLDLGIYFSGTGVTGVGVTQSNLILNAFKENETQLGNGETVTLTLPISGTFESDAVITGINVMLTHGGAAANFSGKSISISNIVFNETLNLSANSLILNGGPDYTFNGNQWDPQLSVSSNSFTVADDYGTITVDIAIPDFTSLRSSMAAGSRSSLNGGSFTYNAGMDLGIYFSGVGVTGVGVTQLDLIWNAFDANATALGNGETVTLTLPISGTLESGAVITGINVMLTHGGAADNFSGKSISISNFVFNPANQIMLNGGPDYTFNGNQWDPQLTINAAAAVPANNGTITVDIAIPDFTSLRSSMSIGSRSCVGGGEFGYGGTDLGIYFSGTGVTGVGVTQYDLFNIFDANATALGNGETVTLTLPIYGTFESGAVITGINVMLAHGGAADNFSGKSISVSNIVFNDPSSISLINGSDYTFNGNQWDPQLEVSARNIVSQHYNTITVDIAIPDFTSLKGSMKYGSRSTLGGGEFSYGPDDLGIYFSGTGVTGVGVTQGDLYSIFDANATALGNGETVTLTLPISGEFESGAEITGVKVMLTYGGEAANFSGKSISISNMELSLALTHVAAKEATVTTKGNNEYYYCENCGKYYADSKGETEILETATVILAGGDFDGNDNVGASDSVMLKKCLFDVAVDFTNPNNGDINGDGNVDILDYVILSNAILDSAE